MPRRETKSVVPAVPRDGEVVSVALESLGNNTFVVSKNLPDSLRVVHKVTVVSPDDCVVVLDAPLNAVEGSGKAGLLNGLIKPVNKPDNVKIDLLARAGENEEVVDVRAINDDGAHSRRVAKTPLERHLR